MQDFFEENGTLPDVQDEYKRVEVNLLVNFWKELRAEMDSHQWSEEQGLCNILAVGLAALRNQRQSESATQDHSILSSVIEILRKDEALSYERYTEMKQYADELKVTSTNLEVQLMACKTQLEILRKANADLLAGLMGKW
jgi:hypothetical protein